MAAVTTLLVDDHAFFRRTLRSFLEQQHTLQVVGEAADGREALEQVGQCHPAVVIMDIHMPHLNGWDACREIKTAYPETKVILYTAADADTYEHSSSPADAFMPKQTLFEKLMPLLGTMAGP